MTNALSQIYPHGRHLQLFSKKASEIYLVNAFLPGASIHNHESKKPSLSMHQDLEMKEKKIETIMRFLLSKIFSTPFFGRIKSQRQYLYHTIFCIGVYTQIYGIPHDFYFLKRVYNRKWQFRFIWVSFPFLGLQCPFIALRSSMR